MGQTLAGLMMANSDSLLFAVFAVFAGIRGILRRNCYTLCDPTRLGSRALPFDMMQKIGLTICPKQAHESQDEIVTIFAPIRE
jgi:hypothetical protein